MTSDRGRELPDDCPCPWVRHNDGSPWVYKPSPDCRHHGAIARPLPPAKVLPFRRKRPRP